MPKKVGGVFSIVILLLIVSFNALAASPKPQGTLTILYSNLGNESLDGVKYDGRESEATLLSLGEGLVINYWDESKKTRVYKPGLASSWESSPDLKTWTFKIRKGIKFHDGSPLTVEDVLFTWNRVLNSPLSTQASAKGTIQSIEIKGNDTIVFNLKKPDAFFLYWVAVIPIQPKGYTEKVGEEEFAKNPVYAGPWKFVKHSPGDYLEMEAFEGHYRKVPFFKKLFLKIVPEPSTQIAMLKAGEADIIFNVTVGPTVYELQQTRDIQLIRLPSWLESYAVFMSLTKPDPGQSPFRDKRVRQALSMAIDRKLLIEKVYYGLGKPASTACIQPGSPFWNPAAKLIPYDIKKAKDLLRQAGYPNGFEIPLILTAKEKTEGEALASMWTKIGVKCKIEIMETGALLAAVREKKLPDCIRISFHSCTPTGIWFYFRKNELYTVMNDEKLHQLTLKMGTMPEGPKMYNFIKNEMCMYVYEMVPNIPIVNIISSHAVRPNINLTEWQKFGCKSMNYNSAAEYIKPK
jgi:ABC-type transport system substrate-binding protein